MLLKIDSCKKCIFGIKTLNKCSYCKMDHHIIVDNSTIRFSCPLKKLMAVPCKVKDTLWFLDRNNYVSWGVVIGFTETHIMVKSAYSENKTFYELLPYEEFNISIFLTEEREDAELKIGSIKYTPKYWETHNFKFGGKN